MKYVVLYRLMNLTRKLRQKKDYYQDHVKFIKGYAESLKGISKHEGKIWYIPHLGVYNPKRKDKSF